MVSLADIADDSGAVDLKERQMSGKVSGRGAMRRITRLGGLSIAAAVGATAAVTAVAALASPRLASTAGSKHPVCTSFVSKSQVTAISGLATEVHPQTFTAAEGFFFRWTPGGVAAQGNIPGSDCFFLDVNPPEPFAQELTNTAYVAVGYGESTRNFRKLRQVWGAGGGAWELTSKTPRRAR